MQFYYPNSRTKVMNIHHRGKETKFNTSFTPREIA